MNIELNEAELDLVLEALGRMVLDLGEDAEDAGILFERLEAIENGN